MIPPPVFWDTWGWVDLAKAGPSADWLAGLAQGQMGRAHTSDYVLLEAFSFIARNHRHREALEFLERATASSVFLHPSDADLVDRAMEAYRETRLGRPLGLVDWTTALLMRDHGIRHIVTRDRAFAQLGFTVLP